MQNGLMQMKLEKLQMIGIFQKKEEKDKPKEWQKKQKNINKMATMWLQILFAQHLLLENYLMQTTIVWVDTIKEGRFADTNAMFVKPEKYDYHVTTQDAENWAPKIAKEI